MALFGCKHRLQTGREVAEAQGPTLTREPEDAEGQNLWFFGLHGTKRIFFDKKK